MGEQEDISDARASDCRLWDIPGYLLWFTADSATAVGVALRYLAVSLIGFSLTGSTVAAGWLGSLAAIAQQATAIFGGTFADRHDRRILIIVNAVVGVVCWGSVAVLLMANRIVFLYCSLSWCRNPRSTGSSVPRRMRCSSLSLMFARIPRRAVSMRGVMRLSIWQVALWAVCCTASPLGCRSCWLRPCTCWPV